MSQNNFATPNGVLVYDAKGEVFNYPNSPWITIIDGNLRLPTDNGGCVIFSERGWSRVVELSGPINLDKL